MKLKTRTRENVIRCFHRTQDDEIRAFLPQKAKSEAETIADYEKTLLPDAKSYGRSVYANSVHVGDIWAYGIGAGDPDAMLSFCLFEKSLWGRGIMTAATELFLSEIQEKFDVKTVGAFTFSRNIASQKVLRHNGFLRSSVLF